MFVKLKRNLTKRTKNGCKLCLTDATLHRCLYKKDIAATLMDNRVPAGVLLGNSQAAKPGTTALWKSLLPDPFEAVLICLEQKVQSWLCALGRCGVMHRRPLQLLSLSPTNPAQRERELSRSTFRNPVIIWLMTVHQSLDSKNGGTHSDHLGLRLVTAVCLLAWRCWNSPGGYNLTEQAATQLPSLDQFPLHFTLPAA